jgi:hypothetical protein
MRPRLACCNSDPRRTLGWEGARLSAARVGGKFGSNAHNLQREKWCNALAGDALTLADWLVAEQNDGAWSLRTLITER